MENKIMEVPPETMAEVVDRTLATVSTTTLPQKSLRLAREHERPAAPGSIDWDTYERDKRRRELTERANLPKRHMRVSDGGHNCVKEWMDALEGTVNALGGGSAVVLIGKRGTGKTQIAVEAARRRINIGRSALYILVMDVFMAIKGAYRAGNETAEDKILARFVAPSLLIIDEITQRGETDWENRMLTHILDHRYLAEKDTILIGNLKAEDLKANIGASVVSRLNETGGIIECNWQSFREAKA